MRLGNQRRIAAQLLKVGRSKVKFDNSKITEVKEAITKTDIRNLIRKEIISKKKIIGVSRSRIRKNRIKKSKGRRKGTGSRKGSRTARSPRKQRWITKMRVQRGFLKLLKKKELITPKIYHTLYKLSKGGFFRSKRHIKLYMEENRLFKKKEK